MEIVLATSNAHKIEELTALLKSSGWTLRTGKDFDTAPDPEENGATYDDNAKIKAIAWSTATRLPALADDSGLEIDALEGRPGLRSSRYASTPDARIDRVLDELKSISKERRTARFVCSVALVYPDGRILLHRGECRGQIGFSRSGDHGFGYDPVFIVDGCDGRTMAELRPEEKNVLSHRARAIAALLKSLNGH